MDRLEFVGQPSGPIQEHLIDAHTVRESEAQIEIRPAVVAVHGQRTDLRPIYHACVGVRQR
jgi:hypothetical protein